MSLMSSSPPVEANITELGLDDLKALLNAKAEIKKGRKGPKKSWWTAAFDDGELQVKLRLDSKY